LNLARALRIQRRDVVALVGGGGKTSAMFRLGDELAAQGWRAITTTSTHISADQLALPPHAIVLPAQGKDLLTGLPAGPLPAHTLLVGAVNPATNKAAGLPPDVIDRILAVVGVDAVINEADGARTLPLKAPADHEPVITPATTLVVPVAGVDVIGQPLDAAHVHRPEHVAALTGARLGQPVTSQLVATVLTHPQGGLKGVPPQARVVALINKVATEAELGTALHLADLLLQAPRLEAVAIGAVQAADPIRLVRSRVAVVVLAAGCSQRFGRFKQLLPWGDGTLLSHTVDVALASQARPVSVVLGCQADACRAALGDRPVEVVVNPDWSRGQSTSVRAGLAALPENVSAVLFHLADQPGVTPAVLDALIDRHAATLAPVVWPEYQGQRGNPVLFDRVTFSDLREVTGDIGAKPVLQAYARAGAAERVAVAEPGVLLDVDRPQDLDRLSPRAHRASRTLNPE
jgi:molybdenum cofactor cytidylyltransferase